MRHLEWLYTRFGKVIIDACTLCAALSAAYLLRFDGSLPPGYLAQALTVGPYLVFATLVSLGAYGTYGRVWRYTNLRDALWLAFALTTPLVIVLLLRFLMPDSAMHLRLPLSVIAGFLAFACVGTMGARGAWRLVNDYRRQRNAASIVPRRVLILGAGDAGVRLARDFAHRDDVRLVGFLDDDARHAKSTILGVPVRGIFADLARVVVARRVDEVVVCCDLPNQRFRALIEECERIPVRVRVLNPADGRAEHVSGRVREIRIEDLLPRQVVAFDTSAPLLAETYRGRRVLVTGAGGSIGAELCRQLLDLQPGLILLLDHDETNLFETHADLAHRGLGTDRLVNLLVDLRRAEAVRRVFADYRPEVVLHAAAFKHVPFLEMHPVEAVENNVVATALLVDVAAQYSALAFTLISTDKAVRPTSVMGATKRAAELIVQQAAGKGLRVSCVRFGNVLDSRGSVLPTFRRQVARGGPVTVTHPDVTRYFMTIAEAARLVLQAGSMGSDGEIFVLDMGERIRIVDLARDVIHLSGLREPDDVEIRFVGMRPGERLHEQLTELEGTLQPTSFPRILSAPTADVPPLTVRRMVQDLADAVARYDPEALLRVLAREPVQLQVPHLQAAPVTSPAAANS